MLVVAASFTSRNFVILSIKSVVPRSVRNRRAYRRRLASRIRARYVVELKNGSRIAQTAVRWVNLGDEDVPEGMIWRIQNPDGTGVRVYRGVTTKN
jgi:hypothetical protein